MKIEAITPSFLNYQTRSLEFNARPEHSFGQWIGENVSAINAQLNQADEALNQLAMGHAEHLHQTMITLESAKLSFQYLEQIRNRLMTAYQELLREQI